MRNLRIGIVKDANILNINKDIEILISKDRTVEYKEKDFPDEVEKVEQD